jgi:hypothetical protein
LCSPVIIYQENTNIMKKISCTVAHMGLVTSLLIVLTMACSSHDKKQKWEPIFNGKNLDDWNIKISGHKLNDNYANTFRVEDGILKVSYDEYQEFGNRFGHIFYKIPFSHYKLRLEYRFVGEQVKGGADWAKRNSGVMFHAQPAESMELSQSFPISIEAQFLGGLGEGERPTGNVCTPGTDIEIDGIRITDHCTTSRSATYNGDGWVKFELVVYGDSLVHHIVEGDTVITYRALRIEDSGLPLKEGFIALQAESHATEFRNIEVLNLTQNK